MGQSNKPQTIGHRYFMGIHFGLAKAVNGIREFRVGGRTAWKGDAQGQARWQISASGLFGGDQGEGGIYGTIDLMQGWEDQPVNPRVKRMLGSALVPAFRGCTTLFYDGLICSMNPYPKPWAARAWRTTADWDDGIVWYPEKATILLGSNTIAAMNGAHIIYEAFANRDWGRGRPRALVHDASFRAAADQLYSEGLGLCICWRRQDGVGALVQSVLDHIGGVLIDDLATGQISLRLIRNDYVIDSLPLFDEDSGLLGIDEDEAADGAGAVNEIVVKFKNMMNSGDDDQVRIQNLAGIQSVGAVISETIEYPHLPTSGLASRVAQRDLAAKSAATRRFKVRLDRRGANVLPGGVIRIRSLKRGYAQLVLRVGKADYGTLRKGECVFTCVIDSYGLPATAYVEVPPPTITPPTVDALPATVRRMFEVSYRDLAAYLTPEQLSAATATSGAVGMLARRPSNAAQDYFLLTRVGSASFVGVDQGDWCPTAQITTDLGYLTTTTRITYGTDISTVSAGAVGLIDNEIIRVVSLDIDTGDIVIARGCADTVPAPHLKGARIWFYGQDAAVDPADYTTGVTVQAKVQTRATGGLLAVADAPTDSLLLAQRQARPYPPGNFKVNDQAYPVEVTGEVTVTWAHRDRVLQADQLVDTTAASIGPEAGMEYRLRIYSGSTLKRTVAALTGVSYNYALATELADGGPFNPLRIVLDSLRDGLYSTQAHDITVARLGLVTAPPIRLSLTASAFGADTTAHLVAMPASVTAGDLLLMHFVNDGNATVSTPAGWTLLNSTLSGTQVRSGWYYKLAAGSEGGTTVDMVTSVAEHAAAQVHRIQAGTFDASAAPAIAVATGTSSTPNPPNLAPAWGEADTLWISAYGADDDDATTAWPYAEGQVYTPSATGTVTCSAASCYLALRVASLDPGTFTMAASEEWVSATVAIKPAP